MNVLQVDGVVKDYALRRVFGGGSVRAVNKVSFAIKEGRTFGLVGESGCGKSTLTRVILALEPPTAGTVTACGSNPHALDARALKAWRRGVQVVAQDPSGALPSHMKVGRIVEEPWRIHGVEPDGGRAAAVRSLLASVGLLARHAEAHPHELSGGQRQRVAIARALALEPRLVICDEPVSALDVSVQAQVLDLFRALQSERRLSYLFISHDLGVVRSVADEVGVMYAGALVERGPVEAVMTRPLHPYTQELLDAAPSISAHGRWRSRASGRASAAASAGNAGLDPRAAGCPYRARCPLAIERCAVETPEFREILPGRCSACHRAEDMLSATGDRPVQPAAVPEDSPS